MIKGPQTVLWGPGASAGTVLFEREPEHFGELGTRVNASLLAGSNGRFDKTLDAAAGGPLGYVRVIGNTAHADDYRDGNNDTVASRYDKWNGDVALGWTPDADTLLELTAGKGDGEAATPGAAWTARNSSAKAWACVSRSPTLARCWTRSRPRSTTTTPTT